MIGRDALIPRRLVRSEGMSAFRHRNFRLFFAGQTVSLIGTWMQQVAQAWLVLTITHDPLWLGITAVAQYGPVIVLGLFAGVAADALPKRRVLIGTQTTMMVLASVLAVLVISGRVELWMILGLAFLLGIASAVDMPVRQAFVMELVGREDIGNAVAINSAMVNGSRVVGPAAAGLAIGAFGVGPTFAINALSFLAVIFGLWLMRDRELHGVVLGSRPTSASAVVRDLKEGLQFVRHTRTVLAAVLILGSVATVGMNFSVLIPAFAADDLASGASGFGFLMAASGVGSLIAAMRLVFGGRPQPFRLATGAIVLGAASVLLALTREFPVALGLMVVIGFGSILMAATANTTIQLAVPDYLRGRIMSVYTTTFAASIPIGGLIMGAVASALGVPAAIGIGGVLSLAIGLAAVAWRRGGTFDLPVQPAAAPIPSGATLTGRPATGRPAPR